MEPFWEENTHVYAVNLRGNHICVFCFLATSEDCWRQVKEHDPHDFCNLPSNDKLRRITAIEYHWVDILQNSIPDSGEA